MKLKTTTTTSFTYDHHSYHHQSTIHSTPHTTIAINRIRVVIFVVDITFLVLVIVVVVIAIVVIRNWLPWHRRGIPLRPRSTPGKTEKVRGRMIEAFYFLPLTINSTLMKKY